MYSSLTPLLLTLLAGVAWRRWSPGGIAAGDLRTGINALITYLLAPALILDVMFNTPLDATLAVIPAVGALCAALTFGLTFILLRAARGRLALTRPQIGALLLATAFGNGLGMALPTVRGILGEAASRVPMIYDVLLTIPVVWTGGVILAARFGSGAHQGRPGSELLRLPPFWVLAAAIFINLSGVAVPHGLTHAIDLLADAAVPLFVLLVGLTLRIPDLTHLRLAAAATLIKVLVPTFILWLLTISAALDITEQIRPALLLTVAAPSVIVGVLLCDRYGLDSELFCVTLTLSTLLYVLAAPLLLRLPFV